MEALDCGGRSLDLSRPCVMGVLNITPDSFSDGGVFLSPQAAIEHGERLVAEGAVFHICCDPQAEPNSDLLWSKNG